MIIKLEGYYHQALLIGKTCTKQQLKVMYLEATDITSDMHEIPEVFHMLHGFEPIAYNEDIEVKYVIDMDTSRIYSPTY